MENSQTQIALEELAGKLSRQCFNYYDKDIDKIDIDYVPDAVSVTFIVNSDTERRILSGSMWLDTLLSSRKVPYHRESVNSFQVIGIPALLDAFKPHQDPAPQTSLTNNQQS